jgi:hypothetical protein
MALRSSSSISWAFDRSRSTLTAIRCAMVYVLRSASMAESSDCVLNSSQFVEALVLLQP